MKSRCKPLISNIFWYWGREGALWTEEQCTRELDDMQALGIDSLILVGLDIHFNELDENKHGFDSLAFFMEQTTNREMKVMLGGTASREWWVRMSLDTELTLNRQLGVRLLQEYGGYESFAGWYISHEIYLPTGGKQQRFVRELYRELATEFHMLDDKDVILSPFFILDQKQQLGPYPYGSPYAYTIWWTECLHDTPIDIIALQDSGEHLSFYTVADREPYFKALREACDNTDKTLWGNLETGELVVDNFEAFERDFGCHVNDPKTQKFWRAVPAAKMKAKAEMMCCYVDKLISWGYREYIRPSLGQKAAEVYDQYRAYVQMYLCE
jgi:hypothetical protein